MRYRIVFLTGLGVGFVLGTRAGRERYEQIRKIARQAWESPAMQQAAGVLQAQATEFARNTRDKVPGMASAARSKAGGAASHIPGRSRAGRETQPDGQYTTTSRGASPPSS